MPLTLLFYEAEAAEPTGVEELADVLCAIPGVEISGRDGDDYRALRWRDPATGAACEGDCGVSPLEPDHLHPDRAYTGFRQVGLALHLPLAVPHWHCVEAGNLVAAILVRLTDLLVLDTEDTVRSTAEGDAEGPGPFDRLRLLASWERLHASQIASLSGLPRMTRRSSVALWRYRRELPAARPTAPDLVWPEALALADGQHASSAAFWPDATHWALPPVDLLVLRRPGAAGAGVLPADELLPLLGPAPALGVTGAVAVTHTTLVDGCFHRARLLPIAQFKALTDGDWVD